jgi:hypothetical protein
VRAIYAFETIETLQFTSHRLCGRVKIRFIARVKEGGRLALLGSNTGECGRVALLTATQVQCGRLALLGSNTGECGRVALLGSNTGECGRVAHTPIAAMAQTRPDQGPVASQVKRSVVSIETSPRIDDEPRINPFTCNRKFAALTEEYDDPRLRPTPPNQAGSYILRSPPTRAMWLR